MHARLDFQSLTREHDMILRLLANAKNGMDCKCKCVFGWFAKSGSREKYEMQNANKYQKNKKKIFEGPVLC